MESVIELLLAAVVVVLSFWFWRTRVLTQPSDSQLSTVQRAPVQSPASPPSGCSVAVNAEKGSTVTAPTLKSNTFYGPSVFNFNTTAASNDFIEAERTERDSDHQQKNSPVDEDKSVWFVDKHRIALINRVPLVTPIADDLMDLIGDEKYSIIKNCITSQEQMRKLYEFLSGGKEIKRRFYKSLQKNEPYLVADLECS